MVFRGIIFDCDGVIVDSEVLSSQCLAQVLTDCGIPTSADQAHERFAGLVDSVVAQQLEDSLPQQQAYQKYAALLQQRLCTDLVAVPGAQAFLMALQEQGIPIAMASNSQPDRIRACLAQTDTLRYFEGRYFGPNEHLKPKPAPDLYLHACRFLGLAPRDCLVIEDSPPGIVAGVAAGCTLWALDRGGQGSILQAVGSHAQFCSYQEIMQALGLPLSLLSESESCFGI